MESLWFVSSGFKSHLGGLAKDRILSSPKLSIGKLWLLRSSWILIRPYVYAFVVLVISIIFTQVIVRRVLWTKTIPYWFMLLRLSTLNQKGMGFFLKLDTSSSKRNWTMGEWNESNRDRLSPCSLPPGNCFSWSFTLIDNSNKSLVMLA